LLPGSCLSDAINCKNKKEKGERNNKSLRCISRKEWTSALGIFSALKRVILLQPDIERTYDPAQREQLTKVLNKLQHTGAKALEHFLDVVKGESSTNIVGQSNVPKDATVHELTSNTIWFIEHLYEHFDVIGSILAQDVLYSTQLDTILMKKNEDSIVTFPIVTKENSSM